MEGRSSSSDHTYTNSLSIYTLDLLDEMQM